MDPNKAAIELQSAVAARLSAKAASLILTADDLVSSPDPELAREGRALLRSAALLYTKAGDEVKAQKVTETVEQLSRLAKQDKIKHKVVVK